ncbi:MAG TPA: DUF4430 domain-containing protein [Jatrophihabitantaceae bacterium]|jgi:hypothetical protein
MPYSKFNRLAFACLTCLASAISAAPALAGTTTAQLRVVNTAGATLADQSQVTGDVTIKTDPAATCFGPPGGSGSNVVVPGPSALGLVKDTADSNPALRPLSVTDQFPFGLGVCGIGGSTFNQGDTASWYLKVNHVGATVGGDQYLLKSGDDVLWYLSPGYPYPNELQLVAPTTAKSGVPFTVTVYNYSDSGVRSPVAGALVTGADLPTASNGSTAVQLTRSVALEALHGADIPSNQEIVACVPSSQSACGPAEKVARHRIIGTNGADYIKGSPGPDLVRARASTDRINTRGGLSDIVNCGRGKDKAVVDSTDITRRCEKVIRKG